MAFRFSTRSQEKLIGVDSELKEIVSLAITYTKIDFGVIEGVRTVAQQKALVESGASQTMESKHLKGRAVDLMAYVNGRGCWELNVYDDIADAMKRAAIESNVAVRWGAAWTVTDIRKWNGTMEQAMNSYIDTRRGQGRRPFIDAPHFELM
jgi:peptidoglycan L-alanyl-D-glutamate endopeptidase CwlK